jgi:hypothetical protein
MPQLREVLPLPRSRLPSRVRHLRKEDSRIQRFAPMSAFVIEPIDLESAHRASTGHRHLMDKSELCGCFYCLSVFKPNLIRRWIDRDTTALCPECGIDSVVPSAAGFPITVEFLKAMHDRWFSEV